MGAAAVAINWVEQGYVPDAVIRSGIRRLCQKRLEDIQAHDCEVTAEREAAFLAAMAQAPIALVPDLANAQHYEVPAALFEQILGPERKYSCCHWPEGVTDLAGAEASALAQTCERAGLADGQDILELGCGWGSLTLWMARRYPGARITAVSNSASQREFILARARTLGLSNVQVSTADMNDFNLDARFDRVVSVEMFEHMRNWGRLLQRVGALLKPGGLFFMHVFAHRGGSYLFEDQGEDDWMSRHFFSGGMMPGDGLAARFQDDLRLVREWRWRGEHYQKTANAWLANMDARREAIMPILVQTYGADQAPLWWMRWRLFFMACAETFGYQNGQVWRVAHYLFQRPIQEAAC